MEEGEWREVGEVRLLKGEGEGESISAHQWEERVSVKLAVDRGMN